MANSKVGAHFINETASIGTLVFWHLIRFPLGLHLYYYKECHNINSGWIHRYNNVP